MQERGDEMNQPETLNLMLCGWWLLFNGWIQYLEIDFLCGVTDKAERKLILLWIGINELYIVAKICLGMTDDFFFHILLLLLFSVNVLNIPWSMAAAPLVIIGTLYTFIEGYSAVCMYWVSRNAESKVWGMGLQIVISVLLSAVYFEILRLVRKRYSDALRWPASSYLYVLLFPCGYIVLLVRIGLKLGSGELEQYFSSIGIDTSITVFFMLSGAMAIFLMMIKIFSIIIDQARRENDMTIMRVQMEGQRIYVEEAEKRNREYSKFQHDIDNHLLVLSGLIRERDCEKAQEYISRLHIKSHFLTELASTGNGVLDILLREKVNYGMRNGIRVSSNVRIPQDFYFDDMDLSVIFANILDNAIQACIAVQCEDKEIFIYTKNHGRFLVIESANSWMPGRVEEGIGLTNIRNVTAKYQGTVEISGTDRQFRISVLLRAPGDII